MEVRIREPAVAGQFYPGSRKQLVQTLQRLMEEVPYREFSGTPKALIVPHAGYLYSGEVAAHGFALLKQVGKQWKRVIAIGPAHSAAVEAMAEDASDFWKTPLGKVKVSHPGFPESSTAHCREHSLEVELPFLQYVLSEFEWVPLAVGAAPPTQDTIRGVLEKLDDDTLLLISSDMSHYYDYERANLLDHRTIKAIEALDYEQMEKVGIACGKAAILIALHIAQHKGWQCRLLKYLNSGDVTGDHSSVVGYASLVFF